MKVEELRVGNLIYDLTDSVARVDSVSNLFDGPMIEAHSSQMLAYREPDCYKPIPLTNKWLKELGFVYFNYKMGPYGIKHSGYQIRYKADSPYSCVRLLQLTYVKEESMYYAGKKAFNIKSKTAYISCVKYVHQLQNLYFALTGNELTIQK